MSPLRTLRQLVAPTGRHRSTPGPERIKVTLRGLSGPQLPKFPEAAYSASIPQAIRHCPGCGRDAGVGLHPSGAYTCGTGHLTLPPTDQASPVP